MKSKKFFAYLLAATMVLGSTVTAFAGNNGEVIGQGESTGSLKEDVVEASLPTANSSNFQFYVDPERLISRSGKLKDGTGITSDAAAAINGVYFNQGGDFYSSVSTDCAIEIKNYCDAKVTVNVAISTAGGISLADDATLYKAAGSQTTTSSTVSMYLGMGVTVSSGAYEESDYTTVTSSGAKKEIEIAGQTDNYTVTTSNGAYVLEEKTGQDVEWKTVRFNLRGAVTETKLPESGVEAPAVTVTWKVEAKNASAAAGIAYTSKAGNGDVTLTFTPGTPAKTLAKTSFKINGVETSGWSSFASNVIYNGNTITVKAAVFDFNSIKNATTNNKYTFTVVDTEGNSYSTAEVTL